MSGPPPPRRLFDVSRAAHLRPVRTCRIAPALLVAPHQKEPVHAQQQLEQAAISDEQWQPPHIPGSTGGGARHALAAVLERDAVSERRRSLTAREQLTDPHVRPSGLDDAVVHSESQFIPHHRVGAYAVGVGRLDRVWELRPVDPDV